MRVNAASQLLD